MRKGNAPFVFSACVVASLALAGCGGDDGAGSPLGQEAGVSSGGQGGMGAPPDGGTSGFEGGHAGRGSLGFGDGGAGTRFAFDGQVRDIGDPNCPAAMPTDSESCTMAATCSYAGGGCTCQRDAHSDAGRTWHCQEFPQRDGGSIMCNDGTASGAPCEMQGKFCGTGGQTCVCFGTNSDDRKWTCF